MSHSSSCRPRCGAMPTVSTGWRWAPGDSYCDPSCRRLYWLRCGQPSKTKPDRPEHAWPRSCGVMELMATILIVDDRVGNRDYLTTLLGYDGHRLLEAANGAAALALLRAERPHLVITDILMPTMDGYEFAQLVRGDPDPSIARIPIIFYTATYNAREGQALALAAGVHYLIAKPAEPQAILDTVNAALGLDPALPAKTDSGLLEDPLRA